MDNPAPASASSIPNVDLTVEETSPLPNIGPRVSVDQLLLAGAHFGHLTQRWNPKMKRFIFTARNGIYLIDLQKTQLMLEAACTAISKIAANGEEILFVGTKKQARDIIESEAKRANSPSVTYRWLGGTLTNFATVRRSLRTLESYEKMAADGTYDKISKKEQLQVEREKAKLLLTLGGIREMRRLPGAVYIVDTKKESIAVSEARKLGIPIFAIVDTNVDPDLIDHPIPANDDAFKSIWLITHAISDAVSEGKRAVVAAPREDKEEGERREGRDRERGPRQRRRKPGDRGGERGERGDRNQRDERASGGDRSGRGNRGGGGRGGERPRRERPPKIESSGGGEKMESKK